MLDVNNTEYIKIQTCVLLSLICKKTTQYYIQENQTRRTELYEGENVQIENVQNIYVYIWFKSEKKNTENG